MLLTSRDTSKLVVENWSDAETVPLVAHVVHVDFITVKTHLN